MKIAFFNQKGLTLMEALIAISLFLMVFIAFLIASSMASRYIQDTTHRLAAIYLCQETIEEYKAIDYRDITGGTFTESGVIIDEGSDLSSSTDDLTGYRITDIENWFVDGVHIGKMITVTVSWTSISGDHQQQLKTGIANPD